MTNDRRLILAASTGGHLTQLVKLAPFLSASPESLWISFDSPQSRSLLREKNFLTVPYIAPRDFKSVGTAYRLIRQHLKNFGANYEEAVSTGAALALAALPAARMSGVEARYIESVSRTEGPSLSGRILHASRLCALETQHASWAGGRWKPRESVMQAFTAARDKAPNPQPKLFVTLGTISPYRLDSLVDAVLSTGLANETTTWQLGSTQRTDLPGRCYETVEDSQFEQMVRGSDVVITHSGVGSILKILETGKFPVVIPRRRERGEHVDDHQLQIAKLVHDSGIAVSVEAPLLDAELIVDASSWTVRSRGA